jgi:hypothetical protein
MAEEARVREVFRGPAFFEVERRAVEVCSVCGRWQSETSSGPVCSLGHGGADAVEGSGKILLGLPHPSGRNLLWNDLGNRRRAEEALRRVEPWVYSSIEEKESR